YVYVQGEDNCKSKFYLMLQETQNLTAGFRTADFFPWMSWIHKFDGLDTRLETDEEDFVDVLLRVQKDPSQSTRLATHQIKGIIM
ncbi:hypothetical protein MKX03_019305, partial [Papaver bracteatum]